MNQIVPTHYVFREFNIPFFGIYGACSTSMESLLLSSIFVDSDSAKVALAATSSHIQRLNVNIAIQQNMEVQNRKRPNIR